MGWVKDFVVNTPFGDMINAAAAEKKAQKQKLDAVAMSLAQHSATQDINRQAAQKERADILAFKTDPENIRKTVEAQVMEDELAFGLGADVRRKTNEEKTALEIAADTAKFKNEIAQKNLPEYKKLVMDTAALNALANAKASMQPEVLDAYEKKAKLESAINLNQYIQEQTAKAKLLQNPVTKLNDYRAEMDKLNAEEYELNAAVISADEDKKAKLIQAKSLISPVVKVTIKERMVPGTIWGENKIGPEEKVITIRTDSEGGYDFLIGNDTVSTSPEDMANLVSPEDFNKLMATAQALVSKSVDSELLKTDIANNNKTIFDSNIKLRAIAGKKAFLEPKLKAAEADAVQYEARTTNSITNAVNASKQKDKTMTPAIFRTEK